MAQDVEQINEYRIRKLRCFLLSGKHVDANLYPYHNNAFQLWQRNWQKTFAELKTHSQLSPDDFVRQDVITALFDGESAVGLLLHTYLDLNLEAVRDHSYLKTYPTEVLEALRQSSGRVLSMEYLTLDQSWRKSQTGVALGEVMLGLGARVLESSNQPAMVVVTRNDRNVNNILYGYGARCLVPNLNKHNVLVDLVSLDQGKTRPGSDPEVNRWIEYFWERRENHSLFGELSPGFGAKKIA